MQYHMRRSDKEFKEPGLIKKVLKETEYVTLAMVKDGEPYLVSLSHGYDEENDCIYVHSAGDGKKLDYLRANPNVWGQAIMDHGYHKEECSHLYATVMFKGKVKWVEDVEEKRHAFKVMMMQLEPENKPLQERLLKSDGIPTTVVARIEFEYLSGKKTPEINL
ncbi:MAG: pyridoxamine 5'-phosphate oxidase family protein [Candidatus Bathyarchaeota archaeon]|nr:pyridoxamine 5'-phosphate oxidase family protein [Candidatus Bathyarchaeota archaeon]